MRARAFKQELKLHHSTHNTIAHHLIWSRGPQSRFATPCAPPAKRPSNTLAAPPYLRVRISKLFGSA
eukprot:5103684-Pleurochrysis_carterae.AAC.1